MYAAIGRALRQAREQRDLSLEQVLRKAGVPRQSVWYMEKGTAATPLPKLAAVAAAVGLELHVSLDEPGHVPAEVIEVWPELEDAQKQAIILFARVIKVLPPAVLDGIVGMLRAWDLSHHA